MPEWLLPIAAQVGGAGALMALAALWLLHRGDWYTKETVTGLRERVVELTAELEKERTDHRETLETERRQHRDEMAEAERRLFNALGVADKITRVVEHGMVERRRGRAA